jgi:hypothetical protein
MLYSAHEAPLTVHYGRHGMLEFDGLLCADHPANYCAASPNFLLPVLQSNAYYLKMSHIASRLLCYAAPHALLKF